MVGRPGVRARIEEKWRLFSFLARRPVDVRAPLFVFA
jgi:hypothetical protein